MPIDTTVVRDVVVVVPGIMGSELVDAEDNPVWSVSAGALVHAIRTLGKSLRDLQLPDRIGDEAPTDPKRKIRATKLLDSLHVIPGLWSPITGYDGLLGFLRSQRFHLVEPVPGDDGIIPNLIPFPYDWRLSNRYNAKLLAKTAGDALDRWREQPGMAEAKLVLVCHSMGGLIARWFAEQEGGAPRIRSLITIGTPHRGSLNAVVTLANGLEPGIGPLRLRLNPFLRSLPSLYQLLPRYDCLVTDAGRTDLDRGNCPGLDSTMLKNAFAFHDTLAASGPPSYSLHKVVGIRQPTLTTVRVKGSSVTPSVEIDGKNQGGDGTVPRLAAEPETGRGQEVHEVAGQHGELQGTRSLLDLLDGILSREEIVWQDARPAVAEGFGVEMADVWSTLEEPRLCATDTGDRRLLASLRDERGQVVREPLPLAADGTAFFGRLPEGGYRAVVQSGRPGGPPPISKPFLVIDPSVGA
jgi:pimeloyl-ACP methyl ester carboxylesterase